VVPKSNIARRTIATQSPAAGCHLLERVMIGFRAFFYLLFMLSLFAVYASSALAEWT
jgi:hypothetical protein